MFCGKCGAQNPEEATFCKECGAPLAAQPQTVMPQPPADMQQAQPMPAFSAAPVQVAAAPDPNQKFKKVGIAVVAGGAVIVIIVLVVLFSGIFGGGGCKAPVDKFFKGLQHGDMNALVDSMFSDDMMKALAEESGMSPKEMMDSLQQAISGEFGGWDLSDNLKYKITDVEDVDKDDLEDAKDFYEEVNVKVKDAKLVKVEVSIELFGQKEETDVSFQVVQVGSHWYINPDEIDGF